MEMSKCLIICLFFIISPALPADAWLFSPDTTKECLEKHLAKAKTDAAASAIYYVCDQFPNGGDKRYEKRLFKHAVNDVAEMGTDRGQGYFGANF
jgi:hypothetical protein